MPLERTTRNLDAWAVALALVLAAIVRLGLIKTVSW
jgi:hypothetical protein